MKNPPIEAVRGDNPDTLGLEGGDAKDPSGFERYGYSARDVEELLRIVNAGIQGVVEAAPEKVLRYAPRVIRIYADQRRKAFGAEATTLQTEKRGEVMAESSSVMTPRGPLVRIHRMAMQPYGGISFATTPEEMRANPEYLKSTAGHEALHILVGRGIHFSNTTEEGIVGRLDEITQGTREALRHFDWDENAVWASSGMRNPADFSSAELTRESKTVPYIAGPVQLRFLATEKLWDICAAQLEIAHATGFMPGSARFAETVRALLPESEANRLLDSIIFREVVPGVQQFIFPNKAKDEALVYTQEADMNPNFGYPHSDMVDNFCMRWKDVVPTKRKMRAHLEKDDGACAIDGTFEIKPFMRLELSTVERSLLVSAPKGVAWKRVTKVQFDTGFRILDLVRERA